MLSETKVIQWTPIDSDVHLIPHIQMCVLTVTMKNGVRTGEPSRHRSILYPGSDLNNIQLAPGEFGPLPDGDKAAIAAWWTPERVAKYSAAMRVLSAQNQNGEV